MPRRLQAQIKQSKPFATLQAQVFVNLMRTCFLLVGQLNDELRSAELSQPQYNILRILRGAGTDGLPSSEIGERMVSRDPDITRLLDRMEARALVERERTAADRRVITVRITAKGQAVVDGLDEPIRLLHERQFGHLSPGDLTTLNTLLENAREVIEA